MNKLTKTASSLHTIFNVAEKVLLALAIAAIVCTALIAAAWLFNISPDMIGTGYENLDIGILEFQIADGFAPDKNIVLIQVAITLALSCVCCLIGRKMVQGISAILSPISQGNPFHETISAELKKLSLLSLVLGITTNLFSVVELIFTTWVYALPDLLISEKIASISTNYTLDISFLICSGILLLLSYIFRYGTQLQQLSDETL